MKSDCFGGPFVVAIWDHLEEFLRCGNLKLHGVRFGETAWHVSGDFGLRCKTVIRIAAICDARCETAKFMTSGPQRQSQDKPEVAPVYGKALRFLSSPPLHLLPPIVTVLGDTTVKIVFFSISYVQIC